MHLETAIGQCACCFKIFFLETSSFKVDKDISNINQLIRGRQLQRAKIIVM